MYGAILGDVIGAPFEFDRGNKSKEFPLFAERPDFTDDTVMTIAVCDGILKAGLDAGESEMKGSIVKAMHGWAEKYPFRGYGGRFFDWLVKKSAEPYGSFGNGSAMRVSSAGWLFESLERTREVARWSAEVTHNHPEGVKGAESVAAAIWLSRNGKSKDEIKEYVAREFGYDLSRTCDQIRPTYRHVESCQETVPQAFAAFFEGNDFEDVVRTAVSLGGDSDTLTDIAAAMAEAFYGVPENLKEKAAEILPSDMRDVLKAFEEKRFSKKSFYGWQGADCAPVNPAYSKIKNPRQLYDLLCGIWSAQTCAPRMRQDWTPKNKTLGQCSITAFLAQDIFGGKVYGILRDGGNYHCYNVVPTASGDRLFDLTSEQFGDEKLCYQNNPEQFRDVHFAKEEKRLRYEALKAELEKALGL